MFPTRNTLVCIAVAVLAVSCSNTSAEFTQLSAAITTSRIFTPTGQFVVQGAILKKYIEAGSTSGPLGAPISNEQPGPNGGRFSKFQLGVIYWSPQSGAHMVSGDIRSTWEDHRGAAGPLGYPTSDEHPVPGGLEQDFQHATIGPCGTRFDDGSDLPGVAATSPCGEDAPTPSGSSPDSSGPAS